MIISVDPGVLFGRTTSKQH